MVIVPAGLGGSKFKVMKNMRNCFLTGALACALVFVACDDNDDDGKSGNDGNGEYKSIEVCMDVNNPLFAQMTTGEDDLIYLFADKDENGKPIMLREILVENVNGEVCDVVCDEQGRPELMVAPNGVKFMLEWLSDTYAAVAAVDPTTGEQINTYVDLAEEVAPTPQIAGRTTVATRSGEMRMALVPRSMGSRGSQEMARDMGVGSLYAPVYVHLSNCNSPVDATCFVDVYDANGSFWTRCGGVRRAEGVYEVQIPKALPYEGDKPLGCEEVVGFLQTVCDVDGVLGDVLTGVGMRLVAIPSPQAKVFGMAISAIQAGVENVCKYDWAFEDVCRDVEKWMKERENELAYQVTLIPYVYALPNDIVGEPARVDLEAGWIEDLKVEWGGEPSVSSFTLNPPAPSSWEEEYTATAELYCVPYGSTVEISVVGTDEYEDSRTEEVLTEERNYTLSLVVPTGDSGVRDVCEVVITTPDGERYSKTVSLVFQ